MSKLTIPTKFDGNTFSAAEANQITASVNTLYDTVAATEGGFLGMIAHNAAAPTPAKNGWYEFSSAGVVSWLPGTPSVEIGDHAGVNYTAPSTYVYGYTDMNFSGTLTPKADIVAPILNPLEDANTEAELPTKFPSAVYGDSSKVLADGIIRSYNGVEWKSTGQTNFYEKVKYPNAGYIELDNGNFTPNGETSTTDFLELSTGNDIEVWGAFYNPSVAGITFYDKFKTRISSIGNLGDNVVYKKINASDIPADTKFYRSTRYNSQSSYANVVNEPMLQNGMRINELNNLVTNTNLVVSSYRTKQKQYNIANPSDFDMSEHLNWGGVFANLEGCHRTGYIPIKKGETLKGTLPTGGTFHQMYGAIFPSDKGKLLKLVLLSENNELTNDCDGAFAIFSFRNCNSICVTSGTDNTVYIPYDYELKNNDILPFNLHSDGEIINEYIDYSGNFNNAYPQYFRTKKTPISNGATITCVVGNFRHVFNQMRYGFYSENDSLIKFSDPHGFSDAYLRATNDCNAAFVVFCFEANSDVCVYEGDAILPSIKKVESVRDLMPSYASYMAKKTYFVKNKANIMFRKNIVNFPRTANCDIQVTSDDFNITNFDRVLSVTPTTASQNNKLKITVRDNQNRLVSVKEHLVDVIDSAANSGKTANILFVGHSMVDLGTFCWFVRDRLRTDGVTVNALGTGIESYNRDTDLIRGEGLSGGRFDWITSKGQKGYKIQVSGAINAPHNTYGANTYKDGNGFDWTVRGSKIDGSGNGWIYLANYSNTATIPASGTITRNSGNTGDATYAYSSATIVNWNPFWNPNTDLVDFAWYQLTFDIATPNVLHLMFGVNDTAEFESDGAIEVYVNSYKTWIDTVKLTIPNCQFIISTCHWGADFQANLRYDGLKDTHLRLVEAFNTLFANDGTVYIQATSEQTDDVNGFPTYTAYPYPNNQILTEIASSDIWHCNDYGYETMADGLHGVFSKAISTI